MVDMRMTTKINTVVIHRRPNFSNTFRTDHGKPKVGHTNNFDAFVFAKIVTHYLANDRYSANIFLGAEGRRL